MAHNQLLKMKEQKNKEEMTIDYYIYLDYSETLVGYLIIQKENDIYSKGGFEAGVNEIYTGGDKSITHRALLFAAMAEGESLITNPSRGLDCQATAAA